MNQNPRTTSTSSLAWPCRKRSWRVQSGVADSDGLGGQLRTRNVRSPSPLLRTPNHVKLWNQVVSALSQAAHTQRGCRDRPSQSLKHSGKWAAVAGSTWQPPQPCPAAPTVTPMPLLIRCHMQLLAIREVWQGHPSGHEDPQRWGHPDPRPGWAVVLNGSSCLDICHLCGAQAVLSRRLSHSRKARGKQFCRSALV